MESLTDRQDIYKWFVGHSHTIRSIKRTLLEYDRFYECDLIAHQLNFTDWKDLSVLDYGCGVGDFGIFFGKLGCKVYFYDYPIYLEIVNIRMENGFINGFVIPIPEANLPHTTITIFSEVLEHLTDPLSVLKSIESKFIYTSSYPYKLNREEYDGKDHKIEAFNQQDSCREYLLSKYKPILLGDGGERRLWVKK